MTSAEFLPGDEIELCGFEDHDREARKQRDLEEWSRRGPFADELDDNWKPFCGLNGAIGTIIRYCPPNAETPDPSYVVEIKTWDGHAQHRVDAAKVTQRQLSDTLEKAAHRFRDRRVKGHEIAVHWCGMWDGKDETGGCGAVGSLVPGGEQIFRIWCPVAVDQHQVSYLAVICALETLTQILSSTPELCGLDVHLCGFDSDTIEHINLDDSFAASVSERDSYLLRKATMRLVGDVTVHGAEVYVVLEKKRDPKFLEAKALARCAMENPVNEAIYTHSLEAQLDWVHAVPSNTSCASYPPDWRKIEITRDANLPSDEKERSVAMVGIPDHIHCVLKDSAALQDVKLVHHHALSGSLVTDRFFSVVTTDGTVECHTESLRAFYDAGGQVVVLAVAGVYKVPREILSPTFRCDWSWESCEYREYVPNGNVAEKFVDHGTCLSFKGCCVRVPGTEALLLPTNLEDESTSVGTPVALHQATAGDGELAYVGHVSYSETSDWCPIVGNLISRLVNH